MFQWTPCKKLTLKVRFLHFCYLVRLLKSFEFNACNLSPPFQYNVLQQSSNVPILENVFHLLKDGMVTMTVGTTQMKSQLPSAI